MNTMSDGDLQHITPREAVERFLQRRETDSTEETLRSYRDRLKRFARWCEGEGMLSMTEVSGRDLQSYLEYRQETLNRTSLNNEFGTLKKFFEWCVAVEAVEPAMPDRAQLLKPSVTKEEEANDERLSAERAEEILEHLERYEYASRDHVVFLILWRIGERMAGLRSLDVDDFDAENELLFFQHRPETGTPLKNKSKSERAVTLAPETAQAIAEYISVNRWDRQDDHGRDPLLTTSQGRIAKPTIRGIIYRLTHPCLHTECPHDEDPESCDAKEHGYESLCPSSYSPHRIRTGSITHMREQGMPPDVVAERVDATPETIRTHYDRSDPLKRAEQRRKHLGRLDF